MSARLAVPIVAFASLVASLIVPGCGREPGTQGGGNRPDSTQVTRRRIVALEAARNFGAGELFRDLRHSDPSVRRAAAVALGRIQDPAALEPLLQALDDPDTNVVAQVTWAIGQLQGVDEAGRYALQTPLVLRVDNRPRRAVALYVEALGKQAGPEVVPVLTQDLATGVLAGMGSEARDPFLEGLAAYALARIGGDEARSALAEITELRNREASAAWRIGAAMAVLPDTADFRACVSLLDHDDRFARAQGARTLGKLGDPRALHPLAQHLSDFDWEVRASILVALAELADRRHPQAEAIDFCAALCGDTQPLVREAAVAALDSFGVGKHAAVLRDAGHDPVPAVRLGALRALARSRPAEARDLYAAARRDSVEFVRTDALLAAAEVLGPAAVDTLERALGSASARERTAAAEALGALRAPATAAAVRRALERALADPDFVVAATAAEALGRCGAGPSLPALVAAYDGHFDKRQDVDVRLAVVEAIGTLAPANPHQRETAQSACERARTDTDPRVAYAAATAAARLAGLPEPPKPPPHALDVPLATDSLPQIDLGQVELRLVTAHGEALLVLDGDNYPRTVANFLRLVDSGFYSHGTFHRVVPAFVVQGGCPRGDGWGDAGWTIPCEYGDLRYDDAGVIGMAHAGKDTGGSQFFITHVPVPRLDGRYTAFGRVREGMNVVDAIVRGDWFRIERVEPVARR